MKKFLLISLISFFSFNAHAAFYIDPYISYLSGEHDQTNGVDMDGVLMGSRAGWSTLGLSFGIDYTTGDLSDDNSNDVTPTQIGFFVGYELPILLRAYGTYYIKDEIEIGNSDWEGTGLKLGVGYTGFPFISLNFEVLASSYDELNGSSVSNELDVDAFMLGVSLPLSL